MKIVLAGVVGVGKSTVSKLLAKKLNFHVIEEPVATNPYLDNFYSDPLSFSFKMQIYMLMIRSKQLKESQTMDNVIFDRSILEDPIFVEVLMQQNNISEIDYQTYIDFYKNVITSSLYFDPQIKPDLIVYLKVSPEIAIQRIMKRGRLSEQIVEEKYWFLLNQEYEKWYQKNKKIFNFLVIDTNNLKPELIVTQIIKTVDKKIL